MEFYFLLAITVFIAAFVQGISGFAFAMVLLGVLPHFMEYAQAVALVSLLAILLVGINAWLYRNYVIWSALPSVTISYIIGTRIGIQILVMTAGSDFLGKLLGVFLMAWAIYALRGNGQVNIKPTVGNGILWGGMGGLIGGLFGMAPIMVFYFLAITKDKEHYMGSMQMFFFIGVCFDILFRSQSAMITPEVLQLAAFSLVFALVGFFIGQLILKRISMPQLQPFIYGFICICGLSLLFG